MRRQSPSLIVLEGLLQCCLLHEKQFGSSDPDSSPDHSHCIMFLGKTQFSNRPGSLYLRVYMSDC